MEQGLQQTISLLTRTPVALNALLHDLPESGPCETKGKTPGAHSMSLVIWFTGNVRAACCG